MSEKLLNYYHCHKKIYYFAFLFSFYIFLGICISYPITYDTDNIFFSADNRRAFFDMVNITGSHYRIKVHPELLILVQAPTLLPNGFVNHHRMTVIVMEAFCGTLSGYIFYEILKCRKIEVHIRKLVTAIYVFSFSNIIFSTVPETFIFANLGLISYWYFILLALEQDKKFTIQEVFLLIFWGCINFGITLTNYGSYLIGLVCLLIKRYGKKDWVKLFFKINVINSIFIVFLCLFQKFIWKQAPLFWESIIVGIKGGGYEELNYMNWNININKTILWIKQTMVYPIFSPDVYISNRIYFGGFSVIKKVFVCLFLLIIILIILTTIKEIISRKQRIGIDGLFFAYCGNLILHYIYGSQEAFIYSCHYVFLLLIIVAVTVDNYKSRSRKTIFTIVLAIFAVAEFCNNIDIFLKTTRLALGNAGVTFSYIRAMKGAVLCGGILFSIYRFLKRKHIKAVHLTYNEVANNYCHYLMTYLFFICIIGFFVAFNY